MREYMCQTMGRFVFHRAPMCYQFGQVVIDLGTLLYRIFVLLHIIPTGNLPMHWEKPFGRSLCSMCWAACDGYWHGLKYITCFFWYKLKNTKRVYRHKGGRRRRKRQPRFSDIESLESESSNNQPSISRKRKSVREGRKAQIMSSRHFSHRHRHHRHHRRYSGSRGISFRVKSGSDRLKINSRKLQEMNVKNHKRNVGSSKRRRLK